MNLGLALAVPPYASCTNSPPGIVAAIVCMKDAETSSYNDITCDVADG